MFQNNSFIDLNEIFKKMCSSLRHLTRVVVLLLTCSGTSEGTSCVANSNTV